MDVIKDPIVEEVRISRSEHSRRFNNNIDDIVTDVKKRQALYGSRLVHRQPKLKLKATGS